MSRDEREAYGGDVVHDSGEPLGSSGAAPLANWFVESRYEVDLPALTGTSSAFPSDDDGLFQTGHNACSTAEVSVDAFDT